MVYKIDNRKKKHSGRYTFLGIVLGISLALGGMYVYENYKQPIVNKVEQIKNTAITYIPQSKPLLQKVDGIDNSQPPIQDSIMKPNITPEKSYSLQELRQLALDDINNYRTQNGLSIVFMDNAKASQVWADHLLNEGCITHREGNVGPMQRYLDNGDKLQMVYENVAGGYGTTWASPDNAIKQSNYEMMYNDLDQNNGHRNNILNPQHQSISIGIAYNSDKLILVEDFQQQPSLVWKTYDLAYDDQKSCW